MVRRFTVALSKSAEEQLANPDGAHTSVTTAQRVLGELLLSWPVGPSFLNHDRSGSCIMFDFIGDHKSVQGLSMMEFQRVLREWISKSVRAVGFVNVTSLILKGGLGHDLNNVVVHAEVNFFTKGGRIPLVTIHTRVDYYTVGIWKIDV